MEFKQIEGWNRKFGPPEGWTDDECKTVYAVQLMHNQEISPGVHVNQSFLILELTPSEADIDAMFAGRPLYLQIYGEGMPPLCIYTLNEEGKPNL